MELGRRSKNQQRQGSLTAVPAVGVRSAPPRRFSETMLDGETGYLVEPGGYAGFLARVDPLLADPKRRLEMGARARAHVASLYSAGETEAKLAPALFGGAATR